MILKRLQSAPLTFVKWGWPILILDRALNFWFGLRPTSLSAFVNAAAFAWILCVPIATLIFLLDRESRERAMSRLCGLREGDERERLVTGDAARATFLLGLALQAALLFMTMTCVRIYWDMNVPQGQKHGTVAVEMVWPLGTPPAPAPGEIPIASEFLLSPSAFMPIALMLMIQIGSFQFFARRRYAGLEP